MSELTYINGLVADLIQDKCELFTYGQVLCQLLFVKR